jgi:hypothetical protein
MILADTSVWVNHFRRTDRRLEKFLLNDRILTHPFVIGEIACGNLGKRAVILSSLRQLPHATMASHDEVLHLLEQHRLWGRGTGWIDAHLLASALLTGCRLWTADRRLHRLATELNVSL